MNPKVAIIIANYNYEDYVIKAINSVLNQTYDGEIRIYVVDDGSSDSSWDKISQMTEPVTSIEMLDPHYKGNIEFRQSNNIFAYKIKNSGASVARNVAMWQAMEWADIFGILDSDDEYYPNKVERLVEKLVEHPEVGVAYADYKIVTPEYSKLELKESYGALMLLQRCMVHSNSLIKKQFIQQVILPNGEIFDSRLHGPGSQEFIGCTEDYDLWIRLSKICIMTHVPECLAIANEHGNNQSLKMTNEIFNQHTQILGSR
jgi:glycosyltransferase involved in cell wall biosynthesis|tara:strand:- start:4846 stop:5622 length:777 start_codon:yes stop_codon:yes gene_type:complete